MVDVRRQSTARTAMSLDAAVLRGSHCRCHLCSPPAMLLLLSLSLPPPLRNSCSHNHLSPLLLTSGVFFIISCMMPAHHSRLVPHTHHPFAWTEHPSNRVIACTLSLSLLHASQELDRLSLQARPWPEPVVGTHVGR